MFVTFKARHLGAIHISLALAFASSERVSAVNIFEYLRRWRFC